MHYLFFSLIKVPYLIEINYYYYYYNLTSLQGTTGELYLSDALYLIQQKQNQARQDPAHHFFVTLTHKNTYISFRSQDLLTRPYSSAAGESRKLNFLASPPPPPPGHGGSMYFQHSTLCPEVARALNGVMLIAEQKKRLEESTKVSCQAALHVTGIGPSIHPYTHPLSTIFSQFPIWHSTQTLFSNSLVTQLFLKVLFPCKQSHQGGSKFH